MTTGYFGAKTEAAVKSTKQIARPGNPLHYRFLW